ncbi:MAG: hypothetical protein SF097_02865 [Acidobacteriota bacterium]|nr:hypothetical protein [Acidobacteriota bacterium]
MPNLDILDNMIAVVVVLLVLSLIVQSIQAAIKKLFRVKSLQLEQSLVHLFYYALDKDAGKTMKTWADRMPLLRAFASLPGLRSLMPQTATRLSDRDSQVKTLFDAVSQEIKNSGRITPGGKVALDSLNKDELKKFIGNMKAEKLAARLIGSNGEQIQSALEKAAAVNQVFTEFNDKFKPLIDKTPLAKFTAPMAQMLANAAELSEKDLDTLTVGDLTKLSKRELAEVNKLIEALPDSIQQTIKQLETNAQKDAAAALAKLNEAFEPVKEELKIVATLPAKLGQISANVDEWYSTIMQGFEERYTRSMKTFALVISFITVFLLNANVFAIYRQVSTNEQVRNMLIAAGPKISQKIDQQKAGLANDEQTQQAITQIADEAIQNVQQGTGMYTSFGFEGPRWIKRVFQNPRSIFSMKAIETLFGWIVMTMLLSVGAPFWQDTLESLFGLKNLLRKQQPGEAQKTT